ncbi:hypothetical protein B0O99DRAFT_636959 [Bisporella sp. PMI_857]|nr:hypothetical protein B0O99DRAFT_636959 [Bisporella sp. PMI_857]
MAAQVTNWKELTFPSKEFDTETGEFRYAMVAAIDDDVFYSAQLNIPRLEISFPEAHLCARSNP